jgi:hypothetical protein
MKLIRTTLIVLLLASCDKVDRYELPGRYVFTHWNRDTIDVKQDGTYRHYTFAHGHKLSNTGTWKLNSNGSEVTFENFSFLTDNMPPGLWISRIRIDEEEIHLMYASDINAYFKKMEKLDSLR